MVNRGLWVVKDESPSPFPPLSPFPLPSNPHLHIPIQGFVQGNKGFGTFNSFYFL